MFGTIRRHQKWLWIAISTVTIVSFVAFFSPNQSQQSGWTSVNDTVGSINGRPVTRDQYFDAYRESQLRYLFSYGDWPGNDSMSRQSGLLERETRNRLFLIDKIEQLNIRVGESSIAQWIRDLPAFRDREDQSFRRDAYEQFVKSALPTHGLSQTDFERFVRHEVGIQHLVTLAGTAGKLVTPQEAERLLRREREEAEAAALFISSSNFLSQVVVEPAAVATYYTNRQADYRIPERMQVSYVKFASSNHFAQAEQELARNTNLNQYVEAVFKERGTNSFKDAAGAPLPPDAAKQKIREELRDSLALESARTNAVAFANALFEIGNQTNALENLAAAKGFVSHVTEPFTQFQPPADLNVSPRFSQIAAKLTPEEPFAEEVIEGPDGIYIIALKQRIPSELPPLDAIRDRVAQDYLNNKALELAQEAGRKLHTAITNAIAQSKTFEAAAAENNASPILLAPFSRESTSLPGLPNTADSSRVVSTAFSLAPGQVSNWVPTRSGGFLVHLKEIVPPTPEKLQAELPEYLKELRQARQYEAFSDWFQKEMEAARITLPGDTQQEAAAR
jgi:hypothetical protein